MKQTISIFLLSMMLVIGLHPMMVMHFCGGNLASVSVIDTNLGAKNCCGMAMSASSSTDNASDDTASAFLQMHKSCCSFQELNISTDNYNAQTQLVVPAQTQLALNFLAIQTNELLGTFSADNSTTSQLRYPPDGLGKLNLDLLSYICIYRI